MILHTECNFTFLNVSQASFVRKQLLLRIYVLPSVKFPAPNCGCVKKLTNIRYALYCQAEARGNKILFMGFWVFSEDSSPHLTNKHWKHNENKQNFPPSFWKVHPVYKNCIAQFQQNKLVWPPIIVLSFYYDVTLSLPQLTHYPMANTLSTC